MAQQLSHIFFFCSSLSGHLDCFHALAIVNSAALNIRIHVSFWNIVLSRYMPRSGIVGSYGNSIFSFLRNLHTIFHSACPSLHSYQRCKSSLFSTSSPTFTVCRLLWWPFWLVLGGIIVLICVSVVISNGEHLFICLFTICNPSLKKCLFWSSTHFSVGFCCCCCCYWIVWALYVFWKLIPCWSHCLQIFPPNL